MLGPWLGCRNGFFGFALLEKLCLGTTTGLDLLAADLVRRPVLELALPAAVVHLLAACAHLDVSCLPAHSAKKTTHLGGERWTLAFDLFLKKIIGNKTNVDVVKEK